MNQDTLYHDLLDQITEARSYLEDKPEETPEGALRTLWFLATGERRAVQRCREGDLPPLPQESVERLRSFLRAHIEGMPLAHLTGRQCFMDIEMLAGREALIPRQETEILGYAALERVRAAVAADGHAQVIDLCTGCGNLALALAYHEPGCRVWGADLSPDAVALAQRNAAHLGLRERVTFSVGDLFAPFDDEQFAGRVDIVVCNPPYIASHHVGEMAPEVSNHEPHLAFDGGPFGVSILMRLIADTPRYLRPGGWLCFEVGLGQGELVQRRLARNSAYAAVDTRSDAAGQPRALVVQRA